MYLRRLNAVSAVKTPDVSRAAPYIQIYLRSFAF
jgi:hypothetical protein